MASLRSEAPQELTSFMDSRWERVDIFRPASNTSRTSKVRMYLSQIDQPLKKCNNDKGNIKLRNHSNAINNLGQSWVAKYVPEDKLVIVNITNHRGESYIEKSRDYMLFPWPNHKIITQSTLYKPNNYFKKKQRFKMDKRCQFIKMSLLPPNKEAVG